MMPATEWEAYPPPYSQPDDPDDWESEADE